MSRVVPAATSDAQRDAWAGDPERVDPDDYPPRHPFVRLMTWAHCSACDLPVHTVFTRYLLRGIDCPHCGASLLLPPEDAAEQLAAALRSEDCLSSQIDAR